MDNSHDIKIKNAKKRAEEKIGFYKHLRTFLVVNGIFLLSSFFWGRFFFMPGVFFWGIGLFIHYCSVFGFPGTEGFLSKDWERKIMEDEIQKVEEKDGQDNLDLNNPPPKPIKKWDEKDLVA